jgi:hypothetical protein
MPNLKKISAQIPASSGKRRNNRERSNFRDLIGKRALVYAKYGHTFIERKTSSTGGKAGKKIV